MKKVLALILSLMLLLPAAGLCEAAADTITLDLGDFTMDVLPTDVYLTGQKTDGGQLFQLYPNYNQNNMFHRNMVGAWMSQNMADVLAVISIEDFAAMMLDQATAQLAQQNIVVTNPQVVETSVTDEYATITFSFDVDYSGVGVDLAMTMVQKQIYVMKGAAGTYLFNLGAESIEGIDEMMMYFDSVAFK